MRERGEREEREGGRERREGKERREKGERGRVERESKGRETVHKKREIRGTERLDSNITTISIDTHLLSLID